MKKDAIETITVNGKAANAASLTNHDVLQMLGAARYAEWMQTQNRAHVMQFLMMVEEENLYLVLGYKKFTEFLDKSGLKKKTSYYKHREFFIKEGPEQYDLFAEWNVPLSTRRLLDAGDIQIDGDDVVIGGEERVSLTNSGSIKAILEKLVKEKIQTAVERDSANAKAGKQDQQLKKLKSENQEFREWQAALEKGTPYEVALLGAVKSLLTLAAEIKTLSPLEISERAEADVATFAEQWKQLYEAYGIRERRPEFERLSGVADREVEPETAKGERRIFSFDEIYDYNDIIRIAKRNNLFITEALDDEIPNVTVADSEDGDPAWQFEADANEVFKLTFEDAEAV